MPSVRCFVSTLPPVVYGGMVGNGPFPAGATPISPANGRSGTRMPLILSNHANFAPSGRSQIFNDAVVNSSASRPKPGMMPVQPHSAVDTDRISICSVSPGSALSM